MYVRNDGELAGDHKQVVVSKSSPAQVAMTT